MARKPQVRVNRSRTFPCYQRDKSGCGACGAPVQPDDIASAHAAGQDYRHECGRVWANPNKPKDAA